MLHNDAIENSIWDSNPTIILSKFKAASFFLLFKNCKPNYCTIQKATYVEADTK